MKRFLIAGNWKMNKTILEAREFASELKSLELKNESELAIIAPYTQLEPLKEILRDTGVKVGAQNVHYEKSGAYTGEVAVDMLKEIGMDCCIVGHSERRQYFAETDETVNRKLKVLLENDIMPILCVGENLAVREEGLAEEFVENQVLKALDGIKPADAAKIVIAYEPIWAIGTGKTAASEEAEDMCRFIRGVVREDCGQDTADNILIQYGGSVKPSNAEEILSKPNINGALIGGASLDISKFVEISKIVFSLTHS